MLCDDGCCAEFMVAQFGVLVQVTPLGDDLGFESRRQRGDAFAQGGLGAHAAMVGRRGRRVGRDVSAAQQPP